MERIGYKDLPRRKERRCPLEARFLIKGGVGIGEMKQVRPTARDIYEARNQTVKQDDSEPKHERQSPAGKFRWWG